MRPNIVCNGVLFMRPGRVLFMRTGTVHNRWVLFIKHGTVRNVSDM
jgi:hypothetical protein